MDFKYILFALLMFINYVAGDLLQVSSAPINMTRVLKSITGVTITGCYMECARENGCQSIAITEGTPNKLPTCYLLKEDNGHHEGENAMTTIQGTGLITKLSAVNGGFSAWKEITSCSSTCGIGHVTYTRSCDNPKPLYGGEDCRGKRVKTEPCLLRYCKVCYGAKNENFAEFKVWKTGQLKGIRLIHISGSLHCSSKYVARWGCPIFGKHAFSVVVTNAERKVLFPEKIEHPNHYMIEDKGNNDDEITLSKAHPIDIYEGQKLRIWEYEDLINFYDWDNSGKHCIYIQLIYKD